MPAPSDLLVLALIVLVSVVIAGRAYFAWTKLAAAGAAARRRSEMLDERSTALDSSFTRARARIADLNVTLERQLWDLPRLDDRIAAHRRHVAAQRLRLDDLRTRRFVAAEDLLGQARAAGRAIKLAMRLRRSLPI